MQAIPSDDPFNRAVTIDGRPWRQRRLPNHYLDFFQGGPRLVVLFHDARGPAYQPDPLRSISGAGFLADEGWSVLVVKAVRRDWFRGRELLLQMGELARTGFFAGFAEVVFYGFSMGGYAALAFSSLATRARVLAYSPQTTLDLAMVPWDVRYPIGNAADWSGPFADAAVSAASAERVVVLYDPFDRSDARHVGRLPRHNLTELKIPFGGHVTTAFLLQWGIFKNLFRDVAAGTLDPVAFARTARRRRESDAYWLEFGQRARRPAVKRACLTRLERLRPDGISTLQLASDVAMMEGDTVAAEAAARRCLVQDPGWRPALLLLARLYKADGRMAEAIEICRQAAVHHPSNHAVALLLAEMPGFPPEEALASIEATLLRLPGHARLLAAKRQLTAGLATQAP